MAYENLAALYDGLMSETDYDSWAQYIDELLRKYHCPGNKLVDLGCGTGNISIPLAAKGWQIIGIDRSEEMLAQARDKAVKAGADIAWLCQDMTQLMLEDEAPHGIIATFDAFNYILDQELLQMMLQDLAWQMADDGLLIFDINTPYKLREVLGNNIYTHHDEHVEYMWENEFDEDNDICQMYLTFFMLDKETGLYRRSQEFHEERVYEPDMLAMWLGLAGFEVLAIYEPLLFEPLEQITLQHKVVFVARKIC